jgi:hypothetical protein
MSQCVITGCSLVDPTHSTELNGDLHQQGDQWIFNGVGEPRMFEGLPMNNRYIAYNVYEEFFERRNIFIIPKMYAVLSPDAENYILRQPR